jgi:hypothetical protein
MTRRQKQNLMSLLGVFIMLAAFAVGFASIYHPAKSDSGVSACQKIAVDKKDVVNTPDDNMTAAQRDEKKAPFVKSHYADIRVAGANVIDTVYKMDNDIDVDLAQSYADMTKISAQWGNLQAACSSHGVDIPGLG